MFWWLLDLPSTEFQYVRTIILRELAAQTTGQKAGTEKDGKAKGSRGKRKRYGLESVLAGGRTKMPEIALTKCLFFRVPSGEVEGGGSGRSTAPCTSPAVLRSTSHVICFFCPCQI